jgi:hypothetical protein
MQPTPAGNLIPRVEHLITSRAWNECTAFSLLSLNRCGAVTDIRKARGNARKPLREMLI